MAKNRGLTAASILLLSVAAVMFVLTVVGACLDWIFVEGKFWIGSTAIDTGNQYTYTLSDIISRTTAAIPDELYATAQAVPAFAILTPIFAGLTAIMTGVCGAFKNKGLSIIQAVCSVAAIVVAILCVIMMFTFCNMATGNMSMGSSFSTGDYSPMIGMWLTAVGGVLAGVVGVIASLKR